MNTIKELADSNNEYAKMIIDRMKDMDDEEVIVYLCVLLSQYKSTIQSLLSHFSHNKGKKMTIDVQALEGLDL